MTKFYFLGGYLPNHQGKSSNDTLVFIKIPKWFHAHPTLNYFLKTAATDFIFEKSLDIPTSKLCRLIPEIKMQNKTKAITNTVCSLLLFIFICYISFLLTTIVIYRKFKSDDTPYLSFNNVEPFKVRDRLIKRLFFQFVITID